MGAAAVSVSSSSSPVGAGTGVRTTAVGSGETYIIASCGAYRKGCLVRVLSPVEGIELNAHTLYLRVNEFFNFYVDIIPGDAENKEVVWESSDPTVVSIMGGIAQARKLGTATITAKTAEGGFTDECEVNVVIPPTGISLSETSVVVNIGATHTLTANLTPDEATCKDVSWTTAYPTIATVDAFGCVTGIGQGRTTITATSLVDGSLKATCSVQVNTPVTGVSLTTPSLSVYTGERKQLVAVVVPEGAINKAVTWSSADESIATVDADGFVTGVAVGATTVTVTTVDGGFTATCAVTVLQGTKAVESVSLNTGTLKLVVGFTYTLVPTVLPADASDKSVTWTSSNSSVASVDASGRVTALTYGTTTVTATTVDGGFTASCVVTVVSFDSGVPGYDDKDYNWQD